MSNKVDLQKIINQSKGDASSLLKKQLLSAIETSIQQKTMWPEKHRNRKTNKVYKPHNYEEEELIYSDIPHNVLVKGGEGSGKGERLSEIVPTPTGYTTIGEIEVGDIVLDELGYPTTVIATSPIFQKDCYKITFDTHEEIICDEDHLWKVESYNYRKSIGRRGAKYPEQSQAKYRPEVLNAKKLFETQRDCYKRRTNYSIPIPIIEFSEKELLIHPYILGSWLGDGSKYGPQLTIGKQEAKEMTKIYQSFGHRLTKLRSKLQYRINQGDNGKLLNELRSIEVLKNKHIPTIYKRASREQRIHLLMGLMDTDGYIDPKTGSCEFTSSRKVLAEDVQELLFTLGIKNSLRYDPVIFDEKLRDRYRVQFNPDEPVFMLERKHKHIKSGKKQSIRKTRRYMVKIEKTETVPTKCISVSSPSHMFLITKNMIPTHNSVFGIVKTLDKLKRGMNGIMVSPSLPHFKKSLWPEFRRWCPWECVVPEQRYMQSLIWKPHTSFELVFNNALGGQSTLLCGGIADPITWEGPNVSFAHMDEARGMESEETIKVLMGRVRIPGPKGEPPQLYITTTPRRHWLFDYFGPEKEDDDEEEYYGTFKEESVVLTLKTEDNIENLDEGFIKSRGSALTESEKRVRLMGEWEDEEDDSKFLDSIVIWDSLKRDLPELRTKDNPNKNWSDVLVVGLDAAVSRDSFALVGVTRDPNNRKDVAVRVAKEWKPPRGGKIDFQGTEKNPGPELFLRWLCKNYNVVVTVYDNHQLHDMSTRLSRDGVCWMKVFSQNTPRVLADQQLYDRILQGQITHEGIPELRKHLQNANAKVDPELHKKRIVKRSEKQKIDLAVALSMANYECIRLNL